MKKKLLFRSGSVNRNASVILFAVVFMSCNAMSFAQVKSATPATPEYYRIASINTSNSRTQAGWSGQMPDRQVSTGKVLSSTPEFAMGPSSEIFQGEKMITYDAMAKNSEKMTYSLDNNSLRAGNTIDPENGDVTYVKGWSGYSKITATATFENGLTASATHTVMVHPLPEALCSGKQIITCNGMAIVSGVEAANGSVSWSHNGSGKLINADSTNPTYVASSADAGQTVILTLTVKASYKECGEKSATASYIVEVKPCSK